METPPNPLLRRGGGRKDKKITSPSFKRGTEGVFE